MRFVVIIITVSFSIVEIEIIYEHFPPTIWTTLSWQKERDAAGNENEPVFSSIRSQSAALLLLLLLLVFIYFFLLHRSLFTSLFVLTKPVPFSGVNFQKI